MTLVKSHDLGIKDPGPLLFACDRLYDVDRYY